MRYDDEDKIKPRDPSWQALMHCKPGAHGKTKKAERRQEKMRLDKLKRDRKYDEDEE